jgi:hypothetical protein
MQTSYVRIVLLAGSGVNKKEEKMREAFSACREFLQPKATLAAGRTSRCREAKGASYGLDADRDSQSQRRTHAGTCLRSSPSTQSIPQS